jgi:hypothetical protein
MVVLGSTVLDGTMLPPKRLDASAWLMFSILISARARFKREGIHCVKICNSNHPKMWIRTPARWPLRSMQSAKLILYCNPSPHDKLRSRLNFCKVAGSLAWCKECFKRNQRFEAAVLPPPRST